MRGVWTERVRNGVLLATGAVYSAGYATVGLVVILALAAREAISRTWRWVPTSLDRPLAAFAAAAILSAVFSDWRRDSIALSVLLTVTMALSVRTVAAFAVGGTSGCRRFLMWWVAGGVAAASWGVLRFDPAGIPAYPPALGPNGAGTTLAVAAILALGLLGSPTRGRRWPLVAGLAILLAGLVGTWSRGGWLGAAAGGLTLFAIAPPPRQRLALGAGLVLLVGLGALLLPRWPELDREIRSMLSLEANRNRIAIWRAVPRMVADHPLVGTGYGTFVHAYPRYRAPDVPELAPSTAHNLPLNTAAEMGLVGLLALVGLCASGFASAWRWVKRSAWGSVERSVATAVLAALVALLANQLVDGTIDSVHIGFGFFAFLTMAAVGDRYLSGSRPAG
jgi:O-antigen ligase